MAVEALTGVPFGIPNDGSGGTKSEDFQLMLASMFEYHPAPGGGTRRGGIYRHTGVDGYNGVELRPDETFRVHEGSAILDMGGNKCTWVAIRHIGALTHDLTPGTAGTVTIYVAPPKSGTNDAYVSTSTATSVNSSWIVLDRIQLPAGWKSTSQGIRVWDKEYAVLQGTSHGLLALAVDSDSAARRDARRYKRLARTFSLSTDSAVAVHLSSTIRACFEDGSGAAPFSWGTTGSVMYEVYIDGVLRNTWERTIDGFATTETWESSWNLSAGSHDIYVESYLAAAAGNRGSTFWQVVQGGSKGHLGDALRVKHDGVRR